MINCDSNPRCAACPIERLPDADDRVKAGDIVRSVVRILSSVDSPGSVSLNTVTIIADERSAKLGGGELTAHVIGAVSINVTGECKVEE